MAEDEGAGIPEAYARSPLSFEENEGQTDPRVRYLTRGEGYTLYLTDSKAVFSLTGAHPEPRALGPSPTPGTALRMGLAGTGHPPEVKGIGPLPGVVSYFKGSDPEDWHTGVPTFARVQYKEVYPGIDLVFRGTREALEYDFLLAPGADPGRIALRFEGDESLSLDEDGDLVINTAVGELLHRAPVIYQEKGGERREIAGAYRLDGHTVGFDLGAYDPALPLVIDPVVLAYSTFLGGAGTDVGVDIAVDGAGAAYLIGRTTATDFPTTPGAFDQTPNGTFDTFVTKVGPTGAAPLAYSTFLGGSGQDRGSGIALDGAGAAYLTGSTEDETTDFPITSGAFDETHNGDTDAFVTKLGPTGALSYSTFLGGSGEDRGLGIAVDGAGAAYLTGETLDSTTDFPTTAGAFDETHNGDTDAFVTKLGPTGAAPLAYSTFLGGSGADDGRGIAVDGAGAAYLTGRTLDSTTDFPTTAGAFDETHNGDTDAFVTKLGPTGAAPLAYSTFLGGSGADDGRGIAVDGAGAAYLTGFTQDSTTDFPTTAGAFDETHNGDIDAFVTKLGPTGAAVSYSTFLGGFDFDGGSGIAVDTAGAAYVAGETNDPTTNFPTTAGAFDQTHNGSIDAFVTKLGPTGAAPLAYSTFLGGSGADRALPIAVDGAGAVYVTGEMSEDSATNFPTTPGAFDQTHNGGQEAFVTKLFEPPPPALPPPTGTCKGRPATLAGTGGSDTLTGTSGVDVVSAQGGNDIVKTLGGKDLICAGDGKDRVNGGGGKDKILGEKGKDNLKGGSGKDNLKGGSGKDNLNGGTGKDTCIGGSGKDKARSCKTEKSIP